MTLYAEKLLPHSIEAEEAVLGSLLIDADCITRVTPLLKPDDFYRERNAAVFAVAIALQQNDMAIDQATIAGELQRREQLDLVGGMAYLSHLVAVTPTSLHAEDYGEVIARTSTMRKLINAASRISELGYSDTDDLEATLRKAEDTLYAVRGSMPGRDFVSMRHMADEYLEEQTTVVEEIRVPVMSGFPGIDEVLGGIQRKDLVILGARPSVGKSTLALNMVVSAAKSGQSCAIFSLEMSRQQLFLRALAAESGIDFHRLRLGLYTISEEIRIIDAVGRLSDLPVYVDDTRFQTIPEMRSKARRLSLENGLDLLVLDYLQLVQGRPGQNNRVQEIAEISRSLKVLAGDLDVGLVACSQLNRLVEHRPNHRPQLSDLRDSGSLEQDADVVMFIHREDLYTTPEEWAYQHPGDPYPENLADIIIAKHRNGPTGATRLRFHDRLVLFESV